MGFGVSRSATDEPRDPAKARRSAMDALARREYGFDELVEKLARAGYARDAALETVATLRDEGLQSDARFVESFVASAARRGKGPRRIAETLAERGIDSATAQIAIDEAGVDWFSLAAEVRLGKFGTELPAAFPDRAKQMRFLQYRGFEHAHIRHAVPG